MEEIVINLIRRKQCHASEGKYDELWYYKPNAGQGRKKTVKEKSKQKYMKPYFLRLTYSYNPWKKWPAILPLIPLKIAMNIVLKGKGGNAILL
jgi:hypothetical protein